MRKSDLLEVHPMSAFTIKVVTLAVAFLTAFAFAAHAESALVRNCTWCHGGSAQGYTPAPRLAGQRRIYIEQQLASFASRTRDAPFSRQYMWGAAANLRPWEAHALSIYFSNLPPRAADDGNRELVARGEAIYQRGMPEENIAACVACHGPNAEGVGTIPRIGGLDYIYLKRRLEQWAEGYHGTLGHPMPHIKVMLFGHEGGTSQLRTGLRRRETAATTTSRSCSCMTLIEIASGESLRHRSEPIHNGARPLRSGALLIQINTSMTGPVILANERRTADALRVTTNPDISDGRT
jgi:cytochrome c553